MPKKGGKKQNKNKNKGGGGGAKVPDVKNIVSPAHKEEDKLLYGEGTIQESRTGAEPTIAEAPAVASASTASPEKAASTVPTEDLNKNVSGNKAIPELQDQNEGNAAVAAALPVREKVATEHGVTGATALPTANSKMTTEQEKLTGQPAGKGTGKEPLAATQDSAPVAFEANSAEKTALGVGAAGTAVGTVGTAEYVKGQKDQQTPAETAVAPPGNAGTLEEVAAKPTSSSNLETKRAPNSTDFAAAGAGAPLLAPHVKRSHEEPIFAIQDRNQPPKKARVDESDVATAQPEPSIPGRYPSPSVAGSTVSGADSGIVTGAKEPTKAEGAAEKLRGDTVAGATTAAGQSVPTPSSVSAVPPPGEAGVSSAPKTGTTAAAIAPVDILEKPLGKENTSAQNGQVGKTLAPSDRENALGARESSAQAATSGKQAELPMTSQNIEPSDRPINSAAVLTAEPVSETKATNAPERTAHPIQQPQEAQQTDQVAEGDKTQMTQKEAKKGGFMAWIRRKFKGEKKTEQTAAS